MTENTNSLSQFTFRTYYRYDEAGNRINKKQYMYVLGEPPGGGTGPGEGGDSIIVDEGDGSGYWALQSNIFYVRDVAGKEIAIYSSTALQQWNFYGLDMVGHMNNDTTKYYYLKDHLGSTRAVINSQNQVVSAQDYDCWGYLLENRTYQPENSKYKFTGKERDKDLENNYDYFGARYYDSRIGRWGGVEPLMDKLPDITPYSYVINNPIKLADDDGNWPRDEYKYLWSNPVEQIENAISEIGKTAETAINKFEAGDYISSFQEINKLPSSPMVDFLTPIGMMEQGPKLLGLSKELNISKEFSISQHAAKKMLERGITEKMISKTLEKGTVYSGHESGALSYILKEGFASGKSLLVGFNPIKKTVTTTYAGKFSKLTKKLEPLLMK